MRSIECLAQLFPDKTGRELFQIQDEDKRNDELQYKKENEASIKMVEDIKQNGGYFKGAFGAEQYYMYKIVHIEFNVDVIQCEVEEIVLFDSQNIEKGILSKDRICFEMRDRRWVSFDEITTGNVRIKEEEYNEIKNYLFGVVPKFFKEEWETKQKQFGKSKN